MNVLLLFAGYFLFSGSVVGLAFAFSKTSLGKKWLGECLPDPPAPETDTSRVCWENLAPEQKVAYNERPRGGSSRPGAADYSFWFSAE